MCGIAGFIDLWDSREARDKQERAAILDRMCRIIQHRGPDDQGVTVKPGVALGMRRLAIIDLVSGNVEVNRLERGQWTEIAVFKTNRPFCAEPFLGVEIDLGLTPPS